MVNDIQELIESYPKWLAEQLTIRHVGEYEEITTPFLDRHNDWIQLYVKEVADNEYLLTDGGYTLGDLADCGVSLDTGKRRSILQTNLLRFGVFLADDNDELVVHATKSTFPQKKHNLIHAILATGDMAYLSTSNTAQLFSEDVKQWMRKKLVRFNEDVNIMGKTALTHRFEIAIPSSPDGKYPERFIQSCNTLSKQWIKALALDWCDVKEVRNAQLFVITKENKPSKSVMEICETYGISVTPFEQIDSISPSITA